MFRDREDAGRQLAELLRGRRFQHPLVLAIPRGGIVTGGVVAQELGAEFDVVLARKLRSPESEELAIGAIGESGHVYLDLASHELIERYPAYTLEERRRQMAEIERFRRIFRRVRPPACVHGRSVIVVDDGIATGSTMIAALQSLRQQGPHELIAAVPVAARASLDAIRPWCDEIVCLQTPEQFHAVGEFYRDFGPVDDAAAVEMLQQHAAAPQNGHTEVEGQPMWRADSHQKT